MDFPLFEQLSNLTNSVIATKPLSLNKKRIASHPSAFKRWLKNNSDQYIYAKVCSPQSVLVENSYEVRRLCLKIYLSNKSTEELMRIALKEKRRVLFTRPADLVITDFKTNYAKDSNEIELTHADDFFLDCYYASQYADELENNLPNNPYLNEDIQAQAN